MENLLNYIPENKERPFEEVADMLTKLANLSDDAKALIDEIPPHDYKNVVISRLPDGVLEIEYKNRYLTFRHKNTFNILKP